MGEGNQGGNGGQTGHGEQKLGGVGVDVGGCEISLGGNWDWKYDGGPGATRHWFRQERVS